MHTNLVVELKARISLKLEHFQRSRGHETIHECKFLFSPLDYSWWTCLEIVDADGYYLIVLW